MKQPTPTTQVLAYVANDGSLWLDEAECLERNQELSSTLFDHVYHNCLMDEESDGFTSEDVTKYIVEYFDEIRSILGK